ncbi:MAG: two-component system OmpR family response regulator [Polaribacter sp.]|jgi:two-component system OmpR family response regulator
MMNKKQPLVRILCAEDDADIQELVSLSLTMVGDLTIKRCDTGLEAVDAVEAFDPQLLLLDVMMPFLDGPGALKAIREIEAYKNIPAVFLTAKVQRHEVEGYLDFGGTRVIPKPFDPMTLAIEIQEFWTDMDH